MVNSIIHGLFDCFQSAQVAITGFEIINYICNIHSTGFKLKSGPLRTGFMTERTLLVNHPGGKERCLVLLRASLSRSQALGFEQTIPMGSVSPSDSRHFSISEMCQLLLEKLSLKLANRTSPPLAQLLFFFFPPFIHAPTVRPLTLKRVGGCFARVAGRLMHAQQ